LVPPCVLSRADPSGLGHATTIYSSVQGPPEVETPTLRDHQQRGDIEIAYVSTKEQLPDIFTKPLDEKTFSKLRNELNILDSRNFN
jgi:hypothetical protein